MKTNIGPMDRLVRGLSAVLIAIVVYWGALTGILKITLLVLAAVLMATALIRFCPLYVPFKISTFRKRRS